jgi:hypothetical protein
MRTTLSILLGGCFIIAITGMVGSAFAESTVKGEVIRIHGEDYHVLDPSGKEVVVRINDKTQIDKEYPRDSIVGDQIEAHIGDNGVATRIKRFDKGMSTEEHPGMKGMGGGK